MSSLEMKIEPIYVIDTHALIWYLTNDKKLGKQAAQVFVAAERGETRLVIPAIVIAEMYYANKKYNLFADFSVIYRQLRIKPYFRFISLRADNILDFDKDSDVTEMHDRIIAGVARRIGAPLLSRDPQVAAASPVAIIW